MSRWIPQINKPFFAAGYDIKNDKHWIRCNFNHDLKAEITTWYEVKTNEMKDNARLWQVIDMMQKSILAEAVHRGWI